MAKSVKTVADLGKLIAEEEKAIAALRSKREALAAKVAELAAEIAQLRGAPAAEAEPKAKPAAKKRGRKPGKKAVAKPAGKAAVKRGRKRSGTSTREIIIGILRDADKPMRAAEIAERLAAAGAQSKSSNPKNVVSALLAQSKEFKRVDKGLYTVKK